MGRESVCARVCEREREIKRVCDAGDSLSPAGFVVWVEGEKGIYVGSTASTSADIPPPVGQGGWASHATGGPEGIPRHVSGGARIQPCHPPR